MDEAVADFAEVNLDDLKAEELANAASKTAEELKELGSSVAAVGQESEPASTPLDLALDALQKKFPTIPPDQFYQVVSEEMGAFGVGAEEVAADGALLKSFVEGIEERFVKEGKESEAIGARRIDVRLLALKAEGVPLHASVRAIRSEFSGEIDKETEAVLSRFETLLSPEILPIKEERVAVESLFYSRGLSNFTPAAFTGFVTVLYDQPDSVISEETKARIEAKFQIPRARILTGKDLATATFAQDEDGKQLHDSPDRALRFQAGMSAYVQPDGKAVVSVSEPGKPARVIYVRRPETWSGKSSAETINYGLIRFAVSDKLDQMTGLFGGERTETISGAPARQEATTSANRFIRLFVGNREPDHVLQESELSDFRAALGSLVDPNNTSEEENFAELEDLGVLQAGELNWHRIEQIGSILRQNRFFRPFAMKDPSAPNRLLKQTLQSLDHHETRSASLADAPASANGESGSFR